MHDYFQNFTFLSNNFFTNSAEIMYRATITPINTRKEIGRAVNPKSFLPTEMKGRTSVTLMTSSVAVNSFFPGTLLKKGILVRTTRTTNDAEMTDSRNQPALNSSGEAWRMKNSTPKVR